MSVKEKNSTISINTDSDEIKQAVSIGKLHQQAFSSSHGLSVTKETHLE